MNDVVPIDVTPKSIRGKYRDYGYVIEYVPRLRRWKWKVSYMQPVDHEDMHDTENGAVRAARKKIDYLCGG